jgi:PAT family beta-lactamase induction signal transducer AmpG
MFSTGFSSALPFSLIGSTLQAWLTKEQVSIEMIGSLGLIQLPYSLKFLWAPLLDRWDILHIGKRKSWMLISQIVLLTFIITMGCIQPAQNLLITAFLGGVIGFFGATQDMAIDAYRIDSLLPEEYPDGTAVYSLGYRIGLVLSGAAGLFIAEKLGWHFLYVVMGCMMLTGIFTTVFLSEPQSNKKKPSSASFIAPFLEFLRQKHVWGIIGFLLLYKLDVVLAMALMTPFLISLQFNMVEIAVVFKIGGLLFNTVGVFLGSYCVKKKGIYWCLWFFEILQILSGGLFWMLAKMGHNKPFMVFSVLAENLCSGMGNCGYSIFLMGLCSKSSYSASQFAIATSIMALTRTLVSPLAGYLVKWFYWENYFLIAMIAGVPSLYLLYRSRYWDTQS